MKKAILFGASGLIGSHLLEVLLSDPDYDGVTIVVRKDLNIRHPKLKVLIGDYTTLPGLKDDIIADEVFIALGTTKKQTPDEKDYYAVDHDYPVLAAKIAKEKGAKSVFVVSSIGANVNSKVFYLKTKGEMERDITALDFEHTHIFRPSMLIGDRKEDRSGEKIFMSIWSWVSPLLLGDALGRYKGIEGKDVAKAMVRAGKDQTEKVKVWHWQQMTAA